MKRDPIRDEMVARVNMELFDLAAELLNRVRASGDTDERRLNAIQRRLIKERNRQYEKTLKEGRE